MGEEFKVPREMLEEMASMRLPAISDRRLQHLMDRNNDGRLSQDERDELESFAALSETISLLRAKAMNLLGWKP